MNDTLDYLIIGGGISGVTMARLLQLSGVKKLRILEAEAAPGGLCRTKQVGSHVLDVGGGHFLSSKYQAVYDFVFAHLPRENFNVFQRISTIQLGEAEVDYPLESNIWQLSIDKQVQFLLSIVRNGEARGLPAPSDFESWIRWKLGDVIADTYMLPYNRKIWGVEPHNMDIDWLHKIPQLDVEEILTASLTARSQAAKMPSHQQFFYPKEGGFQTIFDAILKPVEHVLECDTRVETIELRKDLLVVNDRFHTRKIINTAPWPTLVNASILTPQMRSLVRGMVANSIVVSLHEIEHSTAAHWTYIPNLSVPHHREFFINNFAPQSNRRGVYRETNAKRFHRCQDVIYDHVNAFAYPVPVIGSAPKASQLIAAMARLNIFGLGRWGQWKYLNSDVCIHEAMQLARKLVH